jgi:ArsR family transcriptional regulator
VAIATPDAPGPRFDLIAPDAGDAVALASLVADPTRARILALLRDGPCCVCEMAAAIGERQNNVSNHLARLREAGLVRASRHKVDARWVYYERDEDACAAAAAVMGHLLAPPPEDEPDRGPRRIPGDTPRCRR